IQEREFQNMFLFARGFEAATLKIPASTAAAREPNTTNKKQIIGFAKFRSKDDAMIARDVLSGRKIDPEKGCVLKAEMAKKNLHVKKSGSDVQGTSLPILKPELLATPREGASALDRLAERERQREWPDDNTPISTLYVGGLPSSLPSLAGSVSASQLEDALRSVFSRCPGFRRMSFRHKSQGPMCFIEFEDTQHATRALNEIYGHTLGGLVKGGIRLAYSKNPLGVRGSGSN
ncbi:hypothetical protein P389DRAFT_130942, partial [Cystobasidium minutum MCA 4210]|uniref:uncharacterized protein n=1 Tax=Cystobasidium minutum MCA 4210 TaxID=1397322 RepID=UPI0034CDAEBD